MNLGRQGTMGRMVVNIKKDTSLFLDSLAVDKRPDWGLNALS